MIINVSNFCYRFRLIIFLLLFYVGLCANTKSIAQGFNIYNPADRLQPWVSEVNPAIITSQNAKISVGLKVFHWGFLQDNALGIKESHLNASFPFYLPFGLGVGCDMRYYSSGIFSEINSSIMFGKKIFNRFSMGMKIGLVRVGFAKEKFAIVDASDPLLNGDLWKNCLNLGFGLYYNPGNWSVGMAIDHANNPDIGFQTRANLPLEISAAVGYNFGSIKPTFLIQDDDNWIRYGFAVSVVYRKLASVRFSYENSMPIKMEVLLNLPKKSSLQYALDLPNEDMRSVSMGSHEVTFSYILSNEPDIAAPQILISTNRMKIFEEVVIRDMPPDLLISDLQNMDDLASVYLDTKKRNQNLLIISTGALSCYENEDIRRQRYAMFGSEIVKALRRQPDLKLVLSAEKDSTEDARSLKHYLIQNGIVSSKNINIAQVNSSSKATLVGFHPGHSTITRNEPVLSVEKLIIYFTVPEKTRRLRNWKLTIKNDNEAIIKTYTGKDQLPHQLEWHWRDEKGKIVLPGRYSCTLQIQAMSGQEKCVMSPLLQVTYIKRTVALRFKHQPQVHANKIDKLLE